MKMSKRESLIISLRSWASEEDGGHCDIMGDAADQIEIDIKEINELKKPKINITDKMVTAGVSVLEKMSDVPTPRTKDDFTRVFTYEEIVTRVYEVMEKVK